MSEDTKFSLVFIAVMVVAVTAFIVGTILVVSLARDRPSCFARTANIGMPARWSFYGACQVEIAPGTWVPLERWIYMADH